MQIKQQLVIDNYIAKPIAYLLNFLVRLLGKMLSIDHDLNRKFKTIVICKFKGMGSIIQATAMIHSIKTLHPEAEIIFVSSRANQAILEKIKTIDKIMTIDDKSGFSLITSLSSLLFKLIKIRPDVYIDLEIYSNFSTLVTLFSLSKNRIGFYLRSSSFRMGIYTHMMFFNAKVPISEVYLQIARLFGEIKISPGLYPLNENVIKDLPVLPKQEFIIINPNASDLRIERRWGKENFRKLILKISKEFPLLIIILIGSKGEQNYTQEIIENIENHNVKNLAGKTTIEELISLISEAKLVITNDTGPMHIAFACKTPTICFFGPCAPEQYATFENSLIFYNKVYCSPCVHDFSIPPCKGNNICMQMIQESKVFESFDLFMQKGLLLNSLHTNNTIYYNNKITLGQVNRSTNY